MRKLTIVAVAMLTMACYNEHGSEAGSFGPAFLETVYLRYRIPAVYLLFVADVGSPEAGGNWGGGGSFGSWNADVQPEYTDHTTGTRIRADPVSIRWTTLRASGQSFDLTRGNVLVLHMSPSGSLTITQLPGRRGAHEQAKTIVSLAKAALPRDARVQALPL